MKFATIGIEAGYLVGNCTAYHLYVFEDTSQTAASTFVQWPVDTTKTASEIEDDMFSSAIITASEQFGITLERSDIIMFCAVKR